jgi:beta-lactamase class D
VLDGSDLESRHAPWSTFKIPNLIIALESGFTADLDTMHPWDQRARPPRSWWPEAWRQDQSLRTAFQRSAVWYFQDVAQHVGAPAYRDQLTAWDYGNANAPDGSDSFWLAGELEISVAEQVSFFIPSHDR